MLLKLNKNQTEKMWSEGLVHCPGLLALFCPICPDGCPARPGAAADQK